MIWEFKMKKDIQTSLLKYFARQSINHQAFLIGFIGCFILLIAVISACDHNSTNTVTSEQLTKTQQVWIKQEPLPQSNGLHDIWGSSYSDIFAVGAYGTILYLSLIHI